MGWININKQLPGDFIEIEFSNGKYIKIGFILPDGRFTSNFKKNIFHNDVIKWRPK